MELPGTQRGAGTGERGVLLLPLRGWKNREDAPNAAGADTCPRAGQLVLVFKLPSPCTKERDFFGLLFLFVCFYPSETC